MLKKFTLIVFALLCYTSYAQFQSGEVTYKIKPREKEFKKTIKKESSLFQRQEKSFFNDIKKAIPYIELVLKFNKNESHFRAKKMMTSDNGIDIENAVLFIGAGGVYYTDIEQDLSLHQLNYINRLWLIQREISALDWTISNQTKRINGYVCRKATSVYRSTFLPKAKLTAWFASKIPFQYGPLGIGGLPGMILELDHGYFHYYADDMDFNESDREIEKPSEGKLLPLEEYDKQRKKIAEEMKADFKN